MNLVRINKDITIDKDKVQALISEQHNGRFYTHIYLMGDKYFLVEEYVGDIENLIRNIENVKIY